jgi:actin-like ATPase involved in cell morphogenesis
MAEEPKGFGEQLFSRLKDQGLSKAQIYKVLTLQKLDPEVNELGAKGLLTEAQLLEISKIASAARQKQLAELSATRNLPASWVRELSRLIRNAEKARNDQEANRYWDFYFEVKEQIEREGPTRAVLSRIKGFSLDRPTEADRQAEAGEGIDRRVVSFNKMDLEAGRGLDVGTVNICSAALRRNDGGIVYNIQRNAFLDVRSDAFTKKMLMKLGIDYITQGEKGYVVGDPAFELANIFEKNTRRPMKDGMISPTEPEALLIVSMLVAELLGHPRSPGETCAFSVPADPLDMERNVIYHRGACETVLRKLGYSPKAMIEGHAVVFAELQQQDYTGIGISCGGGMFNVCVAYKSVPALTFATSRGGDWIDNNVASAVGLGASQVCAVKEGGVDILRPKGRVQEAIAIYYRELIHYTIDAIREKFENAHTMPSFSRPVDLVCAGGTSLIRGFIDVFREEFQKIQFPLEVSDIRLARDPLRTVSAGCLQAAIEETRALTQDAVNIAPAALKRAEVSTTTALDTEVRQRVSARSAPAAPLKRGGTAPSDGGQPSRTAPAVQTPPGGTLASAEDLNNLEELEEIEEVEIEELAEEAPAAKPAPPKAPPKKDDDEPTDLPLIS